MQWKSQIENIQITCIRILKNYTEVNVSVLENNLVNLISGH